MTHEREKGGKSLCLVAVADGERQTRQVTHPGHPWEWCGGKGGSKVSDLPNQNQTSAHAGWT